MEGKGRGRGVVVNGAGESGGRKRVKGEGVNGEEERVAKGREEGRIIK